MDEKTTLLIDVQVSASEALKRQQELKQSLEALKKSQAENADKTSEIYIQQEAQIKNLNTQILANSKIIQANEKSVQANSGELKNAEGAYRQLSDAYLFASQRAKDMAVAYGPMNQKTIQATKEAKAMADQLKAVDSSVGQNQRKVGDYAGELGKLPGVFGKVAGGSQNLGASFTMLKANPLFAILSVVVSLFTAISNAMGSGTESGRKLQQVMAPLNDLFKGLVKVMADFFSVILSGASAVAKFAGEVLSFIPAIDKMNKAGEESIRIEKEKQRLLREGMVDKAADAKEELRIAELKKKIMQADKYSVEERLAMAREVDKAERALALDDANRANNNLKNFLQNMKLQGKAQKDFSDEEMQTLTDLQTAKYAEQQKYYDNTRRTASREATLIAEIESEKNAKIEANNAAKEKKEQERAKKKQDQTAAEQKAEQERIQKLKENADKAISALDYELEMARLKNEERLANQQLTDEQIYANRNQTLIDNANNEAAVLDAKLLNEQITQEEFNAQQLLLNQKLKTDLALSDAEFEALKQENKKIAAATDLQNEMAIAEMKNQSLYELKLKQLEADYQAELAAAEKSGADTFLIEQKYTEAKKQLNQAEISAKMDMASSFAGNLSEIFGKNTKIGKMAAAAQIAIDTAKGAMAAYTSTASIPVVGPALGVVAAGAVIAKGARSIKDVWAVKSGLKGDSGGGGASVPTGAVSGSVPASVTGGLVARQSGQTQQQATTQAMDSAMKANPQQPVLVVNDVTTALNQQVQLKSDNSL